MWAVVCVSALVLPEQSPGTSGTEWQRLGSITKAVYLAGILEGWDFQLVIAGSGDEQIENIVLCQGRRTMQWGQIAAIVQKYVDDHPTEWDRPMPFIVLRAMTEACKAQR
jgi:hypothetical protein